MMNLLLGAHMSVAGGLHLALERGAEAGCTALQIFSRNSTQWAAKPVSKNEIKDWNAARSRHPMLPMVHGSYLVNLASPDAALRRKSQAAFLAEARRCEALEIPYLVFHPGAHMGAGEEAGLDRIARALDAVTRRLGTDTVTLLLENTAGQGTSLGHRLEHLAGILEHVERPERLGVCLDTCHLLAAGYDFRTDAGYRDLVAEIGRTVGVERIRAFHLNDSKRELGSRVDRHEHIGQGHVGNRAFRLLLTDPRFRAVPKVIETPKQGDMDRKNLARLRRLARL